MRGIKICNGKVLTPFRTIEKGQIIIEGEKIAYVGPDDNTLGDFQRIDAGGNYVTPGFIDIHTHGGGGFDFMDGTEEAFFGAARVHALHGTTSLAPTTLASSGEELDRMFTVYESVKKAAHGGADFLGLHLEGPYFSMAMRGAQDPRYIRDPKPSEYQRIVSKSGDIIRWSAAPELPGALAFGRYVRDRGILPSIAHTDAVYEQVLEAYENGFTHVTHLYSAMSGVKRINAYRYAGVIESAFLMDGLTVEIIADGCHLPESLLRLIYKIKGPGSVALVSDAMRGAGMPAGDSVIGSNHNGQRVIIEDGVAKMPDRSVFAGSVATSDRLVRTMVKDAGVPILDAVQMMTSTPARIIGADRDRGNLVAGKRADIVIFDEHINVQATIVGGRVIPISGTLCGDGEIGRFAN